MADDRVVSDTVTELFVNTCQRRRLLDEDYLVVMIHCSNIIDIQGARDSEIEVYPLSTGSVAELYVETMLPCFGDVDVMFHRSSELAIPQGQPPPTQLPAEFHGHVFIAEIIDSTEPGYVFLERSYLLTEIAPGGKYNAVQCQRKYMEYNFTSKLGEYMQGPAFTMKESSVTPSDTDLDMVLCARCLLWPMQAADWPTRHRSYGWPDSETVDRVVSNGCDVVLVAHRLFR